MNSDTAWQRLEVGLRALELTLTSTQTHQLWEYLALFERWNRTFNLSAIRDREAMVTLHLLDSLAIAPYLEGRELIDVGTGGGLPGIPLAIAFPDKRFTLLDSAGKKTRFLFQVKQSLGLTNVEINHIRVEKFRSDGGFDTVLSRAFASLDDMVVSCRHLLKPEGVFLAMKGRVPDDELIGDRKHFVIQDIIPLQVPDLHAERCLIVLKSAN